jgi:hypothetical protein
MLCSEDNLNFSLNHCSIFSFLDKTIVVLLVYAICKRLDVEVVAWRLVLEVIIGMMSNEDK